MPMEQWPGPPRDEDNGGCWEPDGFEEAEEDEPGDYLPGANWEPEPEFDEKLSGPEYWLILGLPYPPKDEEDEE